MALTGNTVQSTYLDLVQLEQSGAGLPSHAGKEAALYDGSGAQIVGRSAVRHWLDPHPDAAAFAETWEFSTTGDMTQGELESAGWVFTNCTGAVSNGALRLVGSGAAKPSAYYPTGAGLTGDFDICFAVGYDPSSQFGTSQQEMCEVVSTSGDVSLAVDVFPNGGRSSGNGYKLVYSTRAVSASTAISFIYYSPLILRVNRVSGTFYTSLGSYYHSVLTYNSSRVPANTHGWIVGQNGAQADTYNRIQIGSEQTATKDILIHSIRRFA